MLQGNSPVIFTWWKKTNEENYREKKKAKHNVSQEKDILFSESGRTGTLCKWANVFILIGHIKPG